MGSFGSKLNRRVAPSVLDIPDDETTISTSTIAFEPARRAVVHPAPNKYVIIWLDPGVNDADDIYHNSIKRLRQITTTIHTFTTVADCTQYLNRVKTEKLLMIISNELLPGIWPRIRSMSQIQSIYIISDNGEKQAEIQSEKIKGIFPNAEPICGSVKRDNIPYEQDSLVMSVIPSNKYNRKELKRLNRIFIYWMMVKTIVVNTNYERDAHKDALKNLVAFSRQQYFNNQTELKIIDEFEQNYHQHPPIWWYTRNCFISSMLNRAFQSQDTEIIYRMAFFLKDMHQNLEQVQTRTLKTNQLPVLVYKSHNVSSEDFEKIKEIKGHLLSFNNFITADSNYDAALSLARRAQTAGSGIGLIFRIEVDSKYTSSPFASLLNLSFAPEQGKSFLFYFHSIFRIIDMKPLEERVWQIELTLTAHNDDHLRNLTELLKEETQGSTAWLKLPDLMVTVGDYEQAKDLYYTILQLTPESDALRMAQIYNELGNIDEVLGDYASALAYYQKAIEIRQQNLPANHRSLSVSYNNIGEAQRQLGDYFGALSTHQKTLAMKRQILQPDHLSMATTYNNIALANESLGEFNAALECHLRALAIKQKTLPADHQELGTAYNNIGDLQRSMGNYQEALGYLEKALSIRLKKYSPQDPSLGVPYNNLGLVHRELGDYPKALSYLEKSLDIKLKTHPPLHPSITVTYNNIGDINQQIGQYNDALAAYQKALDIQLKAFSENHPEVATTYNNIGAAHQALGQYKTALSFYENAVRIRLKTLPPQHPALGTCYNNIGHLYQLMGDYNTALEYYQKTLKLQEKSLRRFHPSLAATFNNLADVHRKLDNPSKALTFYKKSLDIKKKNFPADHPSLIITYNNLGVIHQSSKNYSAALECYRQTLDIQKKTLPPNHPDLAAIYNNMGVTFQSMKEYPNALDHYKKALNVQLKSLPPTHPDIATTHNSMATVYVQLFDNKSALEHAESAVNIATQALPPEHPNTKQFRSNFERIRARMQEEKSKAD